MALVYQLLADEFNRNLFTAHPFSSLPAGAWVPWARGRRSSWRAALCLWWWSDAALADRPDCEVTECPQSPRGPPRGCQRWWSRPPSTATVTRESSHEKGSKCHPPTVAIVTQESRNKYQILSLLQWKLCKNCTRNTPNATPYSL